MHLCRKVHEYLGRSGHGLVNRVMCGDGAPLFQLNTFQSFNMLSLKKFIAQIPKMDKHLETEFKGNILLLQTPLSGLGEDMILYNTSMTICIYNMVDTF